MELELIRSADPEVAQAIELELNRQRTHIELIASENFVSPAVMAAMGSCLTTMPTCSPTAAPRPTWRCILRCSSPATP